jgi:phage tail-like protein
MPNVLGASYFQTTRLMEELGVAIKEVKYEENGYRSNLILEQSIPPGADLKEEKGINLTVSGVNPIRYLPNIFKKYDRKNDAFLSRYLWIFHHLLNSITIKLDNLDDYFNPINTNSEFFSWLATWFSVNLDFDVPEEKMRFVVKEAVNLYRWRGTALGLAKYLEIVSGIKPEIREKDFPSNEYVIMDNKLVENPIYEKGSSQYTFVVSFPVDAGYFDVETLKKIHQVIKTEKPVHTDYHVTFEEGEDDVKKSDHAVIGVSEIR